MREFLKKNKRISLLALLFSFLCFGFMLTHYMVNIDEETWLLENSDSSLWLLQNRYGIYLYDMLFTKYGRFTPFFSDVMGIVLWNLSGLLFAYVFFDFEKKDHWWIRLAMLCYYNSVPLCVGEAFAFTMQIIPEAIALVLTAVAFVGTVKPWQKNNKINIMVILGSLTFSFGVYQALICVYITAVAAWCFCRFLEEKPLCQEMGVGIFYSVVSIALYYIINFAIGKLVGTQSYLTGNYIGWLGEQGTLYNLFLAFANVARVSLGITIEDVHIIGAESLCVLMILFIVTAIVWFFRKRGIVKKIGVLLFSLGMVLAPFSLYLVMGTYKTHGRMLIALCLAGMVEILVIYEAFSQKAVQKAVSFIFAGLLIFNASKMNRVYYDSYLVYQYDKSTADAIMYDIQRLGYDYHTKAVVFIGDRKMDPIPIIKSGSLGGSFFSWDGGNILRIIDFMELEGYQLNTPSFQQIEDGLKIRTDMKIWPQEGSIVQTEDSIVVYLSEPEETWYDTNVLR